jgi:hypothetical protein
MHSEMYNSVNTFDVRFKRELRRIEPKKIALMLVGVPKRREVSWAGAGAAGFFIG